VECSAKKARKNALTWAAYEETDEDKKVYLSKKKKSVNMLDKILDTTSENGQASLSGGI